MLTLESAKDGDCELGRGLILLCISRWAMARTWDAGIFSSGRRDVSRSGVFILHTLMVGTVSVTSLLVACSAGLKPRKAGTAGPDGGLRNTVLYCTRTLLRTLRFLLCDGENNLAIVTLRRITRTLPDAPRVCGQSHLPFRLAICRAARLGADFAPAPALLCSCCSSLPLGGPLLISHFQLRQALIYHLALFLDVPVKGYCHRPVAGGHLRRA